jgi:hypothetical protein
VLVCEKALFRSRSVSRYMLTVLHPPHRRLRHQTPRKIQSAEVEKWRFMAEVEVIDGIGRDIIGKKFRRNSGQPAKERFLAGRYSLMGPRSSALPDA